MYADLVWDRDETEHRKFIDDLAPIVLFTYNRLEHTRQTIEALRQNVYAKDSLLFIFSDGAKNEQALVSVQRVRDYLHSVDGFKEIRIIEREENWGLARNIIDGVTSIVNRYGKIIVLEDDIVTSKWFLKYMNDALKIYENESKVMAVSGYLPPIQQKSNLPETFFLHYFSCWGWGTWRRAWAYFDRVPERLVHSTTQSDIQKYNLNGANPSPWQQVMANYERKITTWAVFFYVSIFRNNALVVYSNQDLSGNIGNDGSGENCGVTEIFPYTLREQPVMNFDLEAQQSSVAENHLEQFYRMVNKRQNVMVRVFAIWKKAGWKGVFGKLASKLGLS